MSFSRDLANLISTGATVYDTVSDLASASLNAGVMVVTKGYTTAGDGGGATYLIEAAGADFDDVINHQLANSTVATLQYTDTLHAEQCGLYTGTNHDSASTLQTIVNFAQENNLIVEIPATFDIRLDSTVTFKHGKNGTDTVTYQPRINGNGAIIRCNHNGYCFKVVPRCTWADRATGRGDAYIEIRNIYFDGYFVTLNNYTSAKALVIGTHGYQCASLQIADIENILVTGYLSEPIYLRSCRHMELAKVITRDQSGGVKIETTEEGFAGDVTFSGCAFSGNATRKPLHITSSSSGSQGQCRGVHVTDCIFYGSGTKIEALAGGQTADIWFENCAWDGPNAPSGEHAIEVYAASTGVMRQVYFDNPYIVNFTGHAFKYTTDGTGDASQILIDSGRISSISDSTSVIHIGDVGQFGIRGCDFDANTSTNEIDIVAGASNYVSIQNNSSLSGNTTFINIGAGNDNFIVTGNCSKSTNTVSDNTSGANSVKANNFTMT